MSEGGSDAPDPQGSALPANVHPFFTSAGRGRGRGRRQDDAGSAGGDPPARVSPRLLPLDFSQIESNLRAANDDVESAIDSAEEEAIDRPAEEEALRGRPSKRPRPEAAADAAAQAVFGSEADGAVSEAAETASDVGSEARVCNQIAAAKRMFPIRGVQCIGCALDGGTIGKIDEFVRANQGRLEPIALFKSAMAFYKHTFIDNAALQGQAMPQWGWKDIRTHYTFHAVDPNFQRIDALRSLAACRKTVENALVREEEDGGRALDAKQAELLLKICTLQSRELSLLQAATMPPPPPPRQQQKQQK